MKKINFLIAFLFLAVISIAVIAGINETQLIGCTELNGSGCVCHTTERDTLVKVWIDGPETLVIGQTGYYRMFLAGGPAEAGGYNVAGRFGEMVLVDSFSFKHPLVQNELTQAFPLPFPTPQDTIYWAFGYTASDSSAEWDTIYSCGLSLVWDSIPDFYDRWNFGMKFPVKIEEPTAADKNNLLAEDFKLYQNYPNPFNPATVIRYKLPVSGNVTLKVYDVLGIEVATLVDGFKTEGNYEIRFDASAYTGLSSGIYLYSLVMNELSQIRKMVLSK